MSEIRITGDDRTYYADDFTVEEIELVAGQEYLILENESRYLAEYCCDSGGDFFVTEYGNYEPNKVLDVISLDLAIRAPELEAENERLRGKLGEYITNDELGKDRSQDADWLRVKYFECRGEYAELQDENEQLVEALKRSEQTLRNLGNGELTGDARTIALNEASNISAAIAVEGSDE